MKANLVFRIVDSFNHQPDRLATLLAALLVAAAPTAGLAAAETNAPPDANGVWGITTKWEF